MTGKYLQDLILKEGYSINKMAQMIGKSQPVLASALKHDDVRTGLVEDIAKAMGKPLSFFYGEAYGPVTQANGNNNTQVANNVAGNDITVGSPDNKLIDLLVSKDEQLTMAMKQTEKSIDNTVEVLRQASKSQEQIDELIKLINR